LESKINKEGETWPFRLIELDGDDTVDIAMRKLGSHKILSAPVRNGNKYGIIDLQTIATYVNESDDIEEILKRPLSSICQSQNISIDINESLLVVLTILASESQRVLITEDEKPVGIVSHMDFIRFIAKKWDILSKEMLERPVSEMMSKDPLCIHSEEKLSDAIRKCTLNRYNGAAVIDPKGKMIANFSIADLRGTDSKHLTYLLNHSVNRFLHLTKKDLVKMPVCCSLKTTFSEASKMMFQHHIHRIHVVEEEMKPIGVFSTTDVLFELSRLTQSQ